MPIHANLGAMIVILIIVVILFGRGKVASLGGELGVAIREFRKGLNGGEEPAQSDKGTSGETKSDLPSTKV